MNMHPTRFVWAVFFTPFLTLACDPPGAPAAPAGPSACAMIQSASAVERKALLLPPGCPVVGPASALRFQVEAGTVYRLTTDHDDVDMLLKDGELGVTTNRGPYLRGRVLSWTAPRTGITQLDTFVLVEQVQIDTETPFTISYDIVTQDIDDRRFGTRETIGVGNPIAGELEIAGDRDDFTVNVRDGVVYEAKLVGSASLPHPQLDGCTTDGAHVVSGYGDVLSTLSAPWLSHVEGEVALTVDGLQEGTGDYSLTIVERPDELGIDAASAPRFQVGETQTGLLTQGDEDWLAVELRSGQYLSFFLGLGDFAVGVDMQAPIGWNYSREDNRGTVTADSDGVVYFRLTHDGRPGLSELVTYTFEVTSIQ